MTQDIRHAVRAFRRRPGFTAVVLATLALGIGANTAIFSVVHGVLLSDLPLPDSDRVVSIYETNRRYGFRNGVVNPFNFDQWQRRASTFANLAAMRGLSPTLTGAGEPMVLRGQSVMPSFFDVMRVRPVAGRLFTDEEAQSSHRLVILSHELWRSRFGGDASILNKDLTLEGQRWTVIGIMPSGFSYPNNTSIWMPFNLRPADRANMTSWFLGAVGRLREGVSVETAQAELDSISSDLEMRFPKQRADRGAYVVGLHEDLVVRLADGIKLLQGVVALVLLIACANVANLLMVHTAGRRRELSIRAAIGAGRWRLVRQLLTESLLLSLAGALFGAFVAVWAVKILLALSPQRLPDGITATVGGASLAFTVVLAVATTLLFGVVPSLVAVRGDLVNTLRNGGHGASASHGIWLRNGLIAVETALAIVLLAGAGLLIRSFAKVALQDVGFERESTLTAFIALPVSSYPDDAARARFWQALFKRLDDIPGVLGATGSTALPFSHWEWQTDFRVKGREEIPNDGASIRTVTDGFFATLGIPVLAGREFSQADGPTSERVVVVNEAFARAHLAGLNPLGQQISTSRSAPASSAGTRGASSNEAEAEWGTVVGVVGNSRHFRMEDEPKPHIYRPLHQSPTWMMTLALRTQGDPSAFGPLLKRAVADIDPDLPLQDVTPLKSLVAKAVETRRFQMALLAAFAAVALALAACGMFGVTSFSVANRSREVAIRLALGAQIRRVKQMMIRQGLGPVAAGIVFGMAATLVLTRLIESQLFFTSRRDPFTLLAACATLVTVATVACWIPARRIAKVTPVESLRTE